MREGGRDGKGEGGGGGRRRALRWVREMIRGMCGNICMLYSVEHSVEEMWLVIDRSGDWGAEVIRSTIWKSTVAAVAGWRAK